MIGEDDTDLTVGIALRAATEWELGTIDAASLVWLHSWVTLRVFAYDAAWDPDRPPWTREDMAARIADDLALDVLRARKLCDAAGWPEGEGEIRTVQLDKLRRETIQ